MSFTRPTVPPADLPRGPIARVTANLVSGRDEPVTRPGPARWAGALVVVGLLVVLGWWTVERSVAADGVRRVEAQVREEHLYRQLSNRDAILESQRRIYLERIRRLEAALLGKDQELSALRTRAVRSTQD